MAKLWEIDREWLEGIAEKGCTEEHSEDYADDCPSCCLCVHFDNTKMSCQEIAKELLDMFKEE